MTGKVIVVLGMHRAGTSLCMNIINRLGVRLDTDLISANQHNERGFFESREIMQLNERIFRVLGITWHTLFPGRLSEGWEKDPELAPIRRQLAGMLAERNRPGSSLWGVKDPRLCLLLPLYDQVFADLQIEPFYVVCVRNPVAVASSLKRRNGFPRVLSEMLWMDHTMRAIKGAGKRLRAVVHYENWIQNPFPEARRLAAALELENDGLAMPPEEAINEIVVRELDHCGCKKSNFALRGTGKVYRLLREGRQNEAAENVREIQLGLELGIFPPVVLCQLFWRTAQQDYYTEVNSCCVYTDNFPRQRVVRLSLPANAQQLTGLRLDPSDMPGTAHLHSIRVLDRRNQVIWKWEGDAESILKWEIHNITLAPRSEKRGVVAHFLTNEPSLMIPLKELELNGICGGGSMELEFAPGMEGSASPRPNTTPGTNPANDLLKLHRVLTNKPSRAEVSCQVFWRTADSNKFSEENSCTVSSEIVTSRKTLRLPIPAAIGSITGLRLDPSDRAGLVRILSLRLLNQAGDSVWGWDGAAAAILHWQSSNLTLLSQLQEPGVFAHFQTDDPILILPIPQAQLDRISGQGGTLEFGFAWLGTNSAEVQPHANAGRNRLLVLPAAG